MTTGEWSKRMQEAAERNGGDLPAGGMAGASLVLVAVCGLGFRLKLQVLRMFASEIVWHVHGRRVASARAASRGGAKASGGHSEHHDHQSWSGRFRASHQAAASAASDDDVFERHRRLLGVRRGASKRELKQAYYAAAKQHHPDAVASRACSSSSGSCSSSSSAEPPTAARSASLRFAALKAAHDALAREASS